MYTRASSYGGGVALMARHKVASPQVARPKVAQPDVASPKGASVPSLTSALMLLPKSRADHSSGVVGRGPAQCAAAHLVRT